MKLQVSKYSAQLT